MIQTISFIERRAQPIERPEPINHAVLSYDKSFQKQEDIKPKVEVTEIPDSPVKKHEQPDEEPAPAIVKPPAKLEEVKLEKKKKEKLKAPKEPESQFPKNAHFGGSATTLTTTFSESPPQSAHPEPEASPLRHRHTRTASGRSRSTATDPRTRTDRPRGSRRNHDMENLNDVPGGIDASGEEDKYCLHQIGAGLKFF
ncbi:hypothetical protein quinque_006743 [Culex quinquefasciatus]